MKGRASIALLGGAIASPLNAARGQQAARMRLVAWLGLGRADTPSPYVDALRSGLSELAVESKTAVLGLRGNRVPISLKVFLTALAIIDDVGAVVIIAAFYTGDLSFIVIGLAALVVVILALMNRNTRVREGRPRGVGARFQSGRAPRRLGQAPAT